MESLITHIFNDLKEKIFCDYWIDRSTRLYLYPIAQSFNKLYTVQFISCWITCSPRITKFPIYAMILMIFFVFYPIELFLR